MKLRLTFFTLILLAGSSALSQETVTPPAEATPATPPAAATPATPPAATTPPAVQTPATPPASAAPAPATPAPDAPAAPPVEATPAAPPASGVEETPQAVAQKFCDTHLPGTQEAEQATMLLLTPSLKQAMDDAVKKSDAWESSHPGEKPPLGDGVPFQSYQDVADKCVAGPVLASGNEVDIDYQFDDPLANWTDRVVLVRVDGKWMVDDILYGVNGFDDGLRSALEMAGQDPSIEE